MKILKKFVLIAALLSVLMYLGYQRLDMVSKVRLHLFFAKWKYASEIQSLTPVTIDFDFVIEGSARMIYTPHRPITDYYAPLLQHQPCKLVENTENTIRYEGIGINGKGYIYTVQLDNDWYYIEIYLPT